MAAKSFQDYAKEIARALSEGWGEREELAASKQIEPILRAFQEQIETDCMALNTQLRKERDELASEVNNLARALRVTLKYWRGPFSNITD